MLFACACASACACACACCRAWMGECCTVDGMDNEIEVVDRLLGWIGVEDGARWMRRMRCMQRDAMLSTGLAGGLRCGFTARPCSGRLGRSSLGLISGCSGEALPSVSSRRFVPRVRHVRHQSRPTGGRTNYLVLYIQLLYKLGRYCIIHKIRLVIPRSGPSCRHQTVLNSIP